MGTFHADEMIKYGSNVVGGVTPGKGGQKHLDRPVFNTVKDAVKHTGANASILFVPPAFAADSAMEAADAGIKVCVAIVDGIPSHEKGYRLLLLHILLFLHQQLPLQSLQQKLEVQKV